MNHLTRGMVILYLTAIFLAGAGAGAVGGYTVARQKTSRPASRTDMATQIRARLQTWLELTPEEVEKINPLIQQRCVHYKTMQRCQTEEMSRIVETFNRQVAGVLTSEQGRKFEAMARERQERMGRHGKRQTDVKPVKVEKD